MKEKILHNHPELKQFRRKLRNKATKAERYLWRMLRQSQLEGRKFRRQQSIGKYVVDFFCYSANLAIELDGEVHDNEVMIKHDNKKNAFLKMKGINVLRFKNHEVFDDTENVLKKIKKEFRTDTTPAPLLKGGKTPRI